MEQLTRDGVSLAFEDAGRGAPPLLLVHDLGCDHTSLQPQLEYFRHRHRVVAVDLPGHGQSGPLPRPYALATFAEDLAWLCYELGVYRPVAVGHGVGGMIIVELAARFPGLLAGVVVLDARLLADARTRAQDVVTQVGTSANTEAKCQAEGCDGFSTTDSRKEDFFATLATSPHLATTRENATVWDGATAAAHCGVPMLYVASISLHADVDRFRQLCPHMISVSVRLDQLPQDDAAKRVNTTIDVFLANLLAQK